MQKNLEGKKCPSFSGECTSEVTLTNKDFNDKNLVIYFYPKADTPGCTKESCEFQTNLKKFNNLKTQIVGISKDSVAKQKKFAQKSTFFHLKNFEVSTAPRKN